VAERAGRRKETAASSNQDCGGGLFFASSTMSLYVDGFRLPEIGLRRIVLSAADFADFDGVFSVISFVVICRFAFELSVSCSN
jgi:hypothetical protein